MENNWIPACNGTEVPFKARNGHVLHYMWNKSTGEHAYYDQTADVFLTFEESDKAIWG